MENIKIRVESKFWQEVGKYCVAIFLLDPQYESWFDSCWDKDKDEAEKKAFELVKNHIDFVREMKKAAEVREEMLNY